MAHETQNAFYLDLGAIVDEFGRDLTTLDECQKSGRVNQDVMEKLLHALTTIRGLAWLLGAINMSQLAYFLESVVDEVRLGKVEITPAMLDDFVASQQLFRRSLQAAKDHHEQPMPEFYDVVNRIRSRTQRDGEAPDDPFKHSSRFTEYEEQRLRTLILQGDAISRLRGRFQLATLDRNIEALKAIANQHGEVITYFPTGADDDMDAIELDILIASSASMETLHAAFADRLVTIHSVNVAKVAIAPSAWEPTPHLPKSTSRPAPKAPESRPSVYPSGTIYSVYVRFPLETIDENIEELKATVKPLGEVIDYVPTSEDAEPDLIDLHVSILSPVSAKTLRTALAHFGASVDEPLQPVALAAPIATRPSEPAFANSPKAALIGIFTENQTHALHATMAPDTTLFRFRLSFSLAMLDQVLEAFKAAAKEHGEILAYLPSGIGHDAASIDLDVWLASAKTEDALHAAFAHFGEAMAQEAQVSADPALTTL